MTTSSRSSPIGTGGSVWSAEYRFRRHDGTYATVVDRGYVLHDASGHPVRMIGSVMDVSKQRKAEAIQSAVYKISEAANASKDLPELYRHIHKVIGGLMPATNFYIALYDDQAQTLTFPYFVDEEEGPPPPQKLGRGLTEYVLRTGRPLLASPTVFAELNRSGEVEQVGPPSVDWVGAPLVGLGKTFGVIVVQSYKEGVRFAEEDKAILNFVSEQVAGAIERRRTQENLVQTSSELQAIFRAVPDLYFRLAADGTIDEGCRGPRETREDRCGMTSGRGHHSEPHQPVAEPADQGGRLGPPFHRRGGPRRGATIPEERRADRCDPRGRASPNEGRSAPAARGRREPREERHRRDRSRIGPCAPGGTSGILRGRRLRHGQRHVGGRAFQRVRSHRV